MSLINIFSKKENPKNSPKFIDENLTAEEINEKLWDMGFEEQHNYIHQQISPKKRSEFIKYTLNKAREENKKCIEENGKNIFDYCDIGHP